MAANTKTQGTSKKQLYFVIGGAVVLALLLAIQRPLLRRRVGGTASRVDHGRAHLGDDRRAPARPVARSTCPEQGRPRRREDRSRRQGRAGRGPARVVQPVPEPRSVRPAREGPGAQPARRTASPWASRSRAVAAERPPARGKQRCRRGPIVSGGTPGTVAGRSGLTTATIWVNGSDESVAVKKKFPKTDPTFVLLSLKPKAAQSGSSAVRSPGSESITLKMGQSLTLVNTATGARYTLRLLYTGASPSRSSSSPPRPRSGRTRQPSMPTFAYNAINAQGVEHSGEISATDLAIRTRRAPGQRAPRGLPSGAEGPGADRLDARVHGSPRRRSSRSRSRSSPASSRR